MVMRELVEKEIARNWLDGYEETSFVFHQDGWEVDSDDTYSTITYKKGDLSLIIHPEVYCENMKKLIDLCSDKMLLDWLASQHCQMFR